MTTDSRLERAIRDIPDCLATGMLDLDSGMLLGVQTAQTYSPELLERVAAVAGDLLQGKHVVAIDNMFHCVRGEQEPRHYFQDILVRSRHLTHYFGRIQSNQRILLIAVCRANANIGLVLTEGRTITRFETI